MKDEKRCISFGTNKIERKKVRSKTTVPSARCLLQTIELFVQTTYVVRERGINKSRWLLTIDSFSKGAMEQSIFDIELVHQPIFGESQSENSADSGGLEYQDKGLRTVNPSLLRKVVI